MIHELELAYTESKWSICTSHALLIPFPGERLAFPHAYSGNPGGIRTGPPIKTFGGDAVGESHLCSPQTAIFEGGREEYEVQQLKIFLKFLGLRALLRELGFGSAPLLTYEEASGVSALFPSP